MVDGAYITDFIEIERMVERLFPVVDSYLEFGIPTFIIDPEAKTKGPFLRLYRNLSPRGYIPVMRKVENKIVIKVIRFKPKSRKRPLIFLALFIATLSTIVFSGWLQMTSPALDIVDPNRNIFVNVMLYVLCFILIAGLHEFGHKIACEFHGVKSSLPYFLPGPPEIGGTLGAIIVQETPVVNKDQLFDVGISGPIFGFITSIFVSMLGLKLSYPTRYIIGTLIPSPMIFDLLVSWLVDLPEGHILLLHPVAFAGWIGFLLTFLNIMPIAQLDGGHVARAFFGRKYHRIVSYIGAIILFLFGYYLMAILALAMLFYRHHPGPLDDVSPLSLSRKIIGLIVIPLMLVLSATSFIGLF